VARYGLAGLVWSYLLPLLALTLEDGRHGIPVVEAVSALGHHLAALVPAVVGAAFGALYGWRTVERERALSEVRLLGRLLPVCASCKNIRDDAGYWRQVEDYFQEHAGAEFTHGICPECSVRLYGSLEDDTESAGTGGGDHHPAGPDA
jgi:hypothetical protein